MKLDIWLRALRGTVRFSASGGFPERFLNLCRVRGVELFAPHVHQKVLHAEVLRRDYRKLRVIARQAGMVLRAEEKCGLPFFLQRHRKRLALPVAAAFFALLALGLSQFLWSVQTIGSETLSAEEILSVMAELGLRPGAFVRGIDTASMQDAAMHALSGKASWVGVNINGSRAVVEVHDYADRGKDETYGEPSNMVADFDGLLLSLEAHSGKPAAAVGSGVKTGDLLISGVTEDRYGIAHFYDARGIATALHTDAFSCKGAAQRTFTRYTAVRRVYALRLFTLTLPLGVFPLGRGFDTFTETRLLTVGGVTLPLGVVRQARCYFGEEMQTDGIDTLLDDYMKTQEARYLHTNVVAAETKLYEKNGTMKLSCNSQCIDYIGTRKELQLSP